MAEQYVYHFKSAHDPRRTARVTGDDPALTRVMRIVDHAGIRECGRRGAFVVDVDAERLGVPDVRPSRVAVGDPFVIRCAYPNGTRSRVTVDGSPSVVACVRAILERSPSAEYDRESDCAGDMIVYDVAPAYRGGSVPA